MAYRILESNGNADFSLSVNASLLELGNNGAFTFFLDKEVQLLYFGYYTLCIVERNSYFKHCLVDRNGSDKRRDQKKRR